MSTKKGKKEADKPLGVNPGPQNVGPERPFDQYAPPPESRERLFDIPRLFPTANRVHRSFVGCEMILTLAPARDKAHAEVPARVLFFDSGLNLDTDGFLDPSVAMDGPHQRTTAFGDPVDSNSIPYFVLPLPPGDFWSELGIQQYDIAAVVFKDRVEFAQFADKGPHWKLGEGSMALHRSLGHEPIRSGKQGKSISDRDLLGDKKGADGRLPIEGFDAPNAKGKMQFNETYAHGVLTFVFPGSGNGRLQDVKTVRAVGQRLFTAIGGSAPPAAKK
jgi:hypothetical protein